MAPAHGHSFPGKNQTADGLQRRAMARPGPDGGSVMAVSTPPTLLNVVKAPALPWHLRAGRTILKSLFLRAGRRGRRRKIPSAQTAHVLARRHVWQQTVRQHLEHSEPNTRGHSGLPHAQPAAPAFAVGPAQPTETWPHHRPDRDPGSRISSGTGFSWYKASGKEGI